MVGLRTPRDGVNQRGAARTKVENRNRGSVGRLEQNLIFGCAEKKLGSSIGIVVQKLRPRNHVAGSELIGKRFRPNQVAPELGAQMRRVDTAKNAVPVGVIALATQHAVASLLKHNR